MLETKVVSIYQTPDWKARGFVYIGRAGRGEDGYFSNPIRLAPGAARGSTLAEFEEYARRRVSTDQTYRERVRGLYGETLACFCAQPGPCHGHVLAKLAAELNGAKEPPYLPYAGVGSRNIPEAVFGELYDYGKALAKRGFTLRSGSADGSDTAFERGARDGGGRMEIFRAEDAVGDAAAMALVEKHHPAPQALYGRVRLLMARNSYQILGRGLDSPALFVLCWTPDGAEVVTRRETGGTGQAIRLAVAHGIPVFNFQRPDALVRFKTHLKQLREAGVWEPAA